MTLVRLSPTQLKAYDEARGGCNRHWILNYPLRQRHAEKPQRGKMLGSVTHACLEAHYVEGSIYRPNLTAPKLAKEIAAFTAHMGTEALVNLRKNNPAGKALVKLYGAKVTAAAMRPGSAEAVTFAENVGEDAIQELLDDAPQRAAMVLPKLPTTNTHEITTEHPLTIDVQAVDLGAEWELADGTATDLLAIPHVGDWVEVYDYKTTKGAACKKGTELKHGGQSTGWDPWAYVPDEKELRSDPQVILYATYAMQKSHRRVAIVRFIYVCTQGTPQVKVVEVKLTAEEVEALLRELILPMAREMVAVHREYHGQPAESVNRRALPVIPFWAPDSPCKAYGGCPHHQSKGGVCRTESQSPGLGGLARIGAGKSMGLFDKARKLDQTMRAPEALQAAAKADPEGAEASGLSVPEVATEPPPVAKAEVPPPAPPKGAGRPRRTAKDTDETFAARIREWEKANNVVTTEGEEVIAKPGVASLQDTQDRLEAAEVKPKPAGRDTAKTLPEPTPVEVHAALESVGHPVLLHESHRQVSITLAGSVQDVRALIRGLGGAL